MLSDPQTEFFQQLVGGEETEEVEAFLHTVKQHNLEKRFLFPHVAPEHPLEKLVTWFELETGDLLNSFNSGSFWEANGALIIFAADVSSPRTFPCPNPPCLFPGRVCCWLPPSWNIPTVAVTWAIPSLRFWRWCNRLRKRSCIIDKNWCLLTMKWVYLES